jgi:hypothetical protein
MDTSDFKISFDSKGICDHCFTYDTKIRPFWHTDGRGKLKLEELVKKIKKEGKGKEFDCLMGMSGGIDSSYLLHVVHWCFTLTLVGILK